MRCLLLLMLSYCTDTICTAQSYPFFNAGKELDAGNIRATHLVHGDMWYTPDSGKAHCEYPKGSGKQLGSICNLWLSAYDLSFSPTVSYVSALTYRSSRFGVAQFWPGPVLNNSSDAQRYNSSTAWARIWRVNSGEIQVFKRESLHTVGNTPADIWEWPALGNPHAGGRIVCR